MNSFVNGRLLLSAFFAMSVAPLFSASVPSQAAPASITVTAPNGLQFWDPGDFTPKLPVVTWNSNGVQNVKIDLYKGGVFFKNLVASMPAASGSYTGYKINNTTVLGGDFRVRISSVESPAVFDESDHDFVIKSNSFDCTIVGTLTIQKSPAAITLHWPSYNREPDEYYEIFRRPLTSKGGESGGTALAGGGFFNGVKWVPIPGGLTGGSTSWTDTTVTPGVQYEYKLVRNGYAACYLIGGIDVPMQEDRGTVVLLVDETMSGPLSVELLQMKKDLVGDGWRVIQHDVPRKSVTDTGWKEAVVANKELIKADALADPNVKAVYLLGHVAIPYSGNLNPDGHAEHKGAWPADGYYGDLTGQWTDSTVNNSTTSLGSNFAQQRNLPADGKFDQIVFPSAPTLAVGRVDLQGMPAFALSETELLRQYLKKDHNFRHKLLSAQPRVLIDENFTTSDAENGYQNASLLGGEASIDRLDYLTTLKDKAYLFATGNGGGSLTSASGVATTAAIAANNPRAIFTELFGSYFGDWDHPNNFLRAPLATTYGLTSIWGARPMWTFHQMGIGRTTGDCARLAMNGGGGYDRGYGYGFVHTSLLGDPTLRLHVVQPVTHVDAATSTGGTTLSWSAPSDTDVVGYHVYRATSEFGPFTRLTGTKANNLNPAGSPITATAYTDTTGIPGTTYTYMVRTVKNETGYNPGGSNYFNLSQGAFSEPQVVPVGVPAALAAQPTSVSVLVGGSAVFSVSANGTGPLSYQWKKDGINISGATSATYTIPTAASDDAGAYVVTVSNPYGSATSSAATLIVNTPAALVAQPTNLSVLAGGPAVFSVSAIGTGPLSYQWKKDGKDISGAMSATYTIPITASGDAGSYVVTVSNPYGSATSSAATLIVNTPAVLVAQPRNVSVVAGGSASFSVSAEGTGPLSYQWKKNGTNISGGTSAMYKIPATRGTDAGSYSITVSNPYGSVTSNAATLTVGTAPTIRSQPTNSSLVGVSSIRFDVSAVGTAPLSYQWKKDGKDISGATSATYTIPAAAGPDAGSYSVTVSNAYGSTTSVGATLTVKTPVAFTAQPRNVSVLAGGAVSFSVSATGTGPLSYQWKKDGKDISGATSATYTIPTTAGPDAGSYSVLVSNSCSSATSNAAALTVTIPTSAAEEWGQYNGLISASDSKARSHDKSGYIAISVTAKGTFSAKLSLGSLDFTLTGIVGDDGVLRTVGSKTTIGADEFVLNRKDLPALSLSMQMDQHPGTGKISGSIRQGEASFALISADRVIFSTAVKMAPFQRRVSEEWIGTYTMLLKPTPSTGLSDSGPIPKLQGYAAINAYSNGLILVTGRLPDGTSFSSSGVLTRATVVPMFIRSYQNAGSISGNLSFEEIPSLSDANGEWTWFRPEKAGDPASVFYAKGWPAGISVDARASRYSAPTSGTTVFGTNGTLLPSRQGNATATFQDANPTHAEVKVPFNFLDKQGTALTTRQDLTITVIGNSGLFNGEFFHAGLKRSVTIGGVIYQKQALGAGMYEDSTESGSVFLHLNELK